jgi:chromosome segregation ATPase
MKNKIKEQREVEEKNRQEIEVGDRANEHLEGYIKELEERANRKEENEKLNTEYLNIKNDPDRWMKKNKSFENEVEIRQKQVKEILNSINDLERQIKKYETLREEEDQICSDQEKKITQKDEMIKEMDNKNKQKEELMNENMKKKKKTDDLRFDTKELLEHLSRERHKLNEKKNALSKKIELQKQEYARTDYQFKNHLGLIKEHDNKIGATSKMYEEKVKEKKSQDEYDTKIAEENHLFLGVLVSKRLEETKIDAEKENLKKNITEMERNVANLQEQENKLIEEIKFLSTIREKMARTASQAMAQARETKEELKVKELLILDLNKKFQETEFRLNSFIALYEEVKNARNKYVSLIQNSSQDLAEMKERIKILQNEVEILRNE